MRYVDKHDANSEGDFNSETKKYVDNDYILNYKGFFGGTAISMDSATKFKMAYVNLKSRTSEELEKFKITISH